MRSRFLISAAVMVGAALMARRHHAARAERLLLGAGTPQPEVEGMDPTTPATDGPAPLETGGFVVAGQALAPGHVAVTGVSFARRRPGALAPDAIRLVIESSHNVPARGLVVLDEGGFAPDAEGFTLMLASESPGPFAASGRYELMTPHAPGSPPRVTLQGDIAP